MPSTRIPTLAVFDPGESTGWATFDDNADVVEIGITRSREELENLLETLTTIQQVVIEEFKLFKGKALQQSGSKMETTRVIGVLESWARRIKAPVKMQDPQMWHTGSLWSGVDPMKRGGHKNSHGLVAYCHGYYYLVKVGKQKLEV